MHRKCLQLFSACAAFHVLVKFSRAYDRLSALLYL